MPLAKMHHPAHWWSQFASLVLAGLHVTTLYKQTYSIICTVFCSTSDIFFILLSGHFSDCCCPGTTACWSGNNQSSGRLTLWVSPTIPCFIIVGVLLSLWSVFCYIRKLTFLSYIVITLPVAIIWSQFGGYIHF
jgi:hypothetical protein